MYLSKIRLDSSKRSTLQALMMPQKFHGALESSIPGARERNLWRIDSLSGELIILFLSEKTPNLTSFCEQFCQSPADVQTREYEGLLTRVGNNTRWRFRLTANPVKSIKGSYERGKLHAHTSLNYQKEWLLARCEKNGFRITEDSFDVTQSKWLQFYKSDQNRVSILSVTYEGELEVTDEVLFRNALCSGIGRGKAYGLGMLTVMHI